MKEFLKNNPSLVFGLGLPLLLVGVFLLAAGIPNLMATPPKFDVVFATNYNDHSGGEGVRIRTENGRAHVTFVGECVYCGAPEIYYYQASTKSIRRIPIDIPPEVKTEKQNPANKNRITAISVPELEKLKLNDANPAPDGYEFQTGDNYYSGSGLLPSLFFSRSYNYNEPVLKKDGYRLRMPMGKNYYSSYNVRFIGWVEK